MKHVSPPRMQAAILPGGRLHLHDGPIDLIIVAEGVPDAVRAAYAAATRRFATVLDELCLELPLLREEMRGRTLLPAGIVARRMDAAVRPLCSVRFITRMAAVAGSVADEILSAMILAGPLTRAWVNNGGDIAVHLSPGAVFDVAVVGGLPVSRHTPSPHPEEPGASQASRRMILQAGIGPSFETQPSAAPQDEVSRKVSLFGTTRIAHADPVRGIATSGFGGRSFSLGIADAVTVLASDAASADAAATLVANAVDLPDHPAISRAPANDFDPQSDLGQRRVTRAVGALSEDDIASALDAGVREAQRLRDVGHLVAVALSLRGQVRIVGALPGQRVSDDQGKFT